jgi:PAS domain S-box-containing protein
VKMKGLVAVETSRPRSAASDQLSRAYLQAALDCIVMADASGRVVEFNPAAERTFGYTRAEALGRTLAELIVPPSLRDHHSRAFGHFVKTGEQRLFGRRLELTGMRADGSEFPVELALSLVEADPLLVCGALRDLSQEKRVEEDLRALADEQAALRRVATLVARGARPAEVFAGVAEGVATVLGVPAISMIRFETDGTATKIAGWGTSPFPVGTHFTLDDPSVMASVMKSGRAARIDDYATVGGSQAAALGEAGIRSGIGAPIVVDGMSWGVVVAFSTEPEPLSVDAEARLARFTELVATAIANAQARDDLRKLADEQAALRGVATLVARGAEAAELFARVAAEVAHALDVPLIGMARYEPDGSSTLIGAWGHDDPLFVPGTRLPPHAGLWAEVRRTGRPARVESYARLGDAISTELDAGGARAGVGVPITVNDEVWGVMSALSTDEKPLPEDIEARLVSFTELVATAIANTQARDDLRQLVDEQSALRRVATLIVREATPAHVFATVAEEVARTVDVPLTAVVRFEPDGTATQVGAWGAENPFPVGTAWTLDEQSVSGMVAGTGRPARVDDYSEIPGEIAATLARSAGIHTAVGVPVLVDGRAWGVIMALSTEERPLPEGTESRLAEFTELIATAIANTQARDDLQRLAEEQAALRRVATLVARGTDAPTVFDAVCAETGQLIGASSVNLAHFTPDGFNLTMSGWSLRDTHVRTGTRLPLSPDTINGVIQRSAAPARVDSYERAGGELAALIRQRGIRSEVGAPVIVEGRVWGALIAGTDRDELLPAAAERRVASFAELIATAVANATGRSELIASRARLVTAADEARRRIERNLHDGTQQRLIALGLDLQTLRTSIPTEQEKTQRALARIGRDVEAILEDVRELSRGLHPALLTRGGLQPALRALARRSPIRVGLDLEIETRPPESVEIATYYVVSEALTNAAKHAEASHIRVTVRASTGMLRATVEDDGVGGAEASAGSGLIGLIDRVEALGGRVALDSPPGEGTRISAELSLVAQPQAGIAALPKTPVVSSRDTRLSMERHLSQRADAETLLAAIASVADALYIVDARGHIQYLNATAVRILGYEEDTQLLGRPSHATIHNVRPDGSPFPAAECPLLRPRVTGETVRVDDDWFVRQDGSLVPVAYSSAPIDLPDGRGAVVAFTDRTLRQPSP